MHTSRVGYGRVALVVLLGLAGAGRIGLGARQTQAPLRDTQGPRVTFKVDINYVEIAALVVGPDGRFVPGLQKGDFQVFEDRKLQTIETFGVVEVPVERPETALFLRTPIEPDVRGNGKAFDGRVYVLVMDDLHVEFQNTRLLKDAARTFILNVLGANDIAAVVSTSGRTDAAQDFTPSKPLLLAAVDRFVGRSLPSVTLSKLDSPSGDPGATAGVKGLGSGRPAGDPLMQERADSARASLSMMRRLSELMAGIHGRRKAMIFFSEGIDFDLNSAIATGGMRTDVSQESRFGVVASGPARDVQMDGRETIAAATRANVAIYSVDPRGLSIAGPVVELGLLPANPDPTANMSAGGVEADQALKRFSLQTLAEGTGGFAAVDTNRLDAAFARIQEENSTYYVLGYYPTNNKRDGRFRSIEVKTTRRGLSVRARKGYVAPQSAGSSQDALGPTARIPQPLLDVLASPLQSSGLGLTAFAAPFRGTPPNAAVTVVVQADGRDLSFRARDGVFEGAVDLSIVAINSQGKTKSDLFRTVSLPLRPESHKLVEQHGVRMVFRIEVPPGRYQLRIAGMDRTTQRVGSVHYDLEVPDFQAQRLSMSGLVLTSSLAGLVPMAGGSAVDDLRKVLPGPPTVSRAFRVGEELMLMAEIYATDGGAPHTVDVATSVRTDEGREIYRQEEQHGSSELGRLGGGFDYSTRVPLRDMPPGLYVLKVEAKSRLGDVPAVLREVQFRIVP